MGCIHAGAHAESLAWQPPRAGDNGEAVRALKVAVKTDPKDKQSRLMLAVSLFGLGEFSDAAKYFGEVGDARSRRPGRWAMRGRFRSPEQTR